MSIGFPDGQRITQWLGAPLVEATARAIGNVLVTDGPFNLSSWASVIVAIKPTGGNVTVTVRQRVNGGPASLELPQTFIVPAGQTGFESIVLFGDTVYIDLTGSAPGVTVDYAVYPANTTTNAQVLATAAVNVQLNDALVASEGTLDFQDNGAHKWSITDDPTNLRLKLKLPKKITGLIDPSGSIVQGSGFTVAHGTVAYVVSFTTPFLAPPCVLVQPVKVNATPTGAIITATSVNGFTVYLYQSNLAGDPVTNAFNQEFFFTAEEFA